ncbi:MAG: alpha/beta fold hydrolase [Bacilli bacterium]|nr:alpha/beta fold hydrolase [Bacilli bacterium]
MDKFSLTLPNGKQWKGRSFPQDGATRNLLILTGMCEHAQRYKGFAEYLNSLGFNVYVLDAMGQGLNVDSPDNLQKVHEGDFEDNIEAAYIKLTELKDLGLPSYLMGHSMGSFMTQYFIELHPNYADKVVLCGSNGGQAGLMSLSKVIAYFHVNKKNWDKPSHFIQNLVLGSYSKSIKKQENRFRLAIL